MVRNTIKGKGGLDSDSDRGECIATKEGDAQRIVVFWVAYVPLHYNREVRIMITVNLSCKVYDYIDIEQAGHQWRKGSSYGDVISHASYQRHGIHPGRHPRWTSKIKLGLRDLA